MKRLRIICIIVLFLFDSLSATAENIIGCIFENNIKFVSSWNDKLCIVTKTEDAYEINIYNQNGKKTDIIYTGKFDGVYKVDGSISKYFFIIYGSSAVSNIISLLKWDKDKNTVTDFDDARFDGDSRMNPEIIHQRGGFKLITFGNVHDTGWEEDKSKWFAHVYTFNNDILKSIQKVPVNKKFSFALK